MGCGQSLTCGTIHHFSISSFLLIIIAVTFCTQFIRFNAEAGRPTIMKPIGYAKIGSKPPRCERRCNSCGHCEAIQVPTNPQYNKVGKNNNSPESTRIAYSRGGGDDYSNYKPMSWKCKCGDLIFNP